MTMASRHTAGVSAFQAPGKRHKAHMHEPGAKNGPLIVQLPESFQTPRPAGLPHLKVPTPGTAGGKATMESSTAAPVPVSHMASRTPMPPLHHPRLYALTYWEQGMQCYTVPCARPACKSMVFCHLVHPCHIQPRSSTTFKGVPASQV